MKTGKREFMIWEQYPRYCIYTMKKTPERWCKFLIMMAPGHMTKVLY